MYQHWWVYITWHPFKLKKKKKLYETTLFLLVLRKNHFHHKKPSWISYILKQLQFLKPLFSLPPNNIPWILSHTLIYYRSHFWCSLTESALSLAGDIHHCSTLRNSKCVQFMLTDCLVKERCMIMLLNTIMSGCILLNKFIFLVKAIIHISFIWKTKSNDRCGKRRIRT